jgi:hypothetical protein
VIAAIQAMATFESYKLTFNDWADRITGDDKKGDYWKKVFEEHPEFFRLDSKRQRASLVWRRQYPKLFYPDKGRRLTSQEYGNLSDQEKEKVLRDPLTPSDIKALLDTAINLHSREVAMRQESKAWIPIISGLASAIGGLVGGVSAAIIGK